MSETGWKTFEAMYREELPRAILAYPEEYAYSVNQAPTVADKMMAAVREGSYNKDSRAIKAVCKRLGIKHTYTAIREYLNA